MATIVQDVQLLINDLTGVFFIAQQVYDAINEVQLYQVADSRWDRVATTIQFNTGDDLVAIPPAIMIPQYLEFNDFRFFPTTQYELERFNRMWRYDMFAQPKAFVLWDWSHFRPYPRPDQDYDFTLWGIVWPNAITATNLDLPATANEDYRRAISYLSAAKLLEFTRPDIADAYTALAEDALARYNKMLRNQQGHNIRIFRPATSMDNVSPGTVFVIGQGGDISHINMFPSPNQTPTS